jgi:hypothetical protein
VEGECFAAWWGIHYFRPYIWGTTFTLETDHAALRWLNTFDNHNSRLMRWALDLQPFSMIIKYRKGSRNANADGLSRLPRDDALLVGEQPFEGGQGNDLEFSAENISYFGSVHEVPDTDRDGTLPSSESDSSTPPMEFEVYVNSATPPTRPRDNSPEPSEYESIPRIRAPFHPFIDAPTQDYPGVVNLRRGVNLTHSLGDGFITANTAALATTPVVAEFRSFSSPTSNPHRII